MNALAYNRYAYAVCTMQDCRARRHSIHSDFISQLSLSFSHFFASCMDLYAIAQEVKKKKWNEMKRNVDCAVCSVHVVQSLLVVVVAAVICFFVVVRIEYWCIICAI